MRTDADRTLEYAMPARRERRWPFILFCCGCGVALFLFAFGMLVGEIVTYQSTGFIVVSPVLEGNPMVDDGLVPTSQPATSE
jgi:hypothetical protein